MKMRSAKQIWSSFMAQIERDAPVDTLSLLKSVQRWLVANPKFLDAPLRSQYGLDTFMTMNLSEYATGASELDPREELVQLRRVPATRVAIVAMRIRDILWSGTAFKSLKHCPNCGQDDLRVLSTLEGQIVLGCDRCVWGETVAGEPRCGPGPVVPADAAQLRKAGLIK